MPKNIPVPQIKPESWQALLAIAADLSEFAPWEFCYDSDVVGLIDSVTSEKRICSVLGNAGEVFAVVIYRRNGLRWILSMLSEPDGFGDFNNLDAMDCLKVEFVPKRELDKQDQAALKSAAFKPAGKGAVWPQFRSAEPGWHQWYINQAEADQIIADLPRLVAFYKMLESHPDLFDGRAVTEVPFLPAVWPDRPLTPDDLDWQPLLPPVDNDLPPFQPDNQELKKLRALKHAPDSACEFDCVVMPGASFIQDGRPCFGRCSLMADIRTGMVLGVNVHSAVTPPADAAGNGLMEALLSAGYLPGRIVIGGSRLEPVLKPLCDELKIQLQPVSSLLVLDQALASLSQHMSGKHD